MTHPVAVSIGLPFLNARKTLADAIRSVFAQTHADWELLLVDDGSSDGSLAIAEGIQDPRVRVIADGVNRGLPTRLNQIAALARGKYLARMDADDLMHPERLGRQLKFLEANETVDLLDTTTYTIDEHNEPLGMRGEAVLACDPATVLKQGLLIHPAVMGRTHWFRAHPYDPAFVRAEDRELWSRVCTTTVFARLRQPLFFYRESLAGNLKNYLHSARTTRKIIRVYGPAAVGRCRTALLGARSHLKSWAYRLCARLGLQGRLIRKRNRPLDEGEAGEARAVIRAILQTSVPGLAEGESTTVRGRYERVAR